MAVQPSRLPQSQCGCSAGRQQEHPAREVHYRLLRQRYPVGLPIAAVATRQLDCNVWGCRSWLHAPDVGIKQQLHPERLNIQAASATSKPRHDLDLLQGLRLVQCATTSPNHLRSPSLSCTVTGWALGVDLPSLCDTLHRMRKGVRSHTCATDATHDQPRRLPYLPNPDYCLFTRAVASYWRCNATSDAAVQPALPHQPRLPAAASSCAIRSRSPDDVLSSMSPVYMT